MIKYKGAMPTSDYNLLKDIAKKKNTTESEIVRKALALYTYISKQNGELIIRYKDKDVIIQNI